MRGDFLGVKAEPQLLPPAEFLSAIHSSIRSHIGTSEEVPAIASLQSYPHVAGNFGTDTHFFHPNAPSVSDRRNKLRSFFASTKRENSGRINLFFDYLLDARIHKNGNARKLTATGPVIRPVTLRGEHEFT